MFDFPKATQVDLKVPKKTFYENLTVSSMDKKLFVEQLTAIYWRYKLTADNLKVSGGDINEIEIFELQLSKKEFSKDILKLIDKGIPYQTVFVVNFGEQGQLWIAHKEISSDGTVKLGTYYNSEWVDNNWISLSLKGLSIEAIYKNFFYQIVPELSACETKSIADILSDYERNTKLQKEITRLEKLAKKEKQPKKKFEIVQKINQLKKVFAEG